MKRIILKILLIFFSVLLADRLIGSFFSRYIFKKTLSGESGGSFNFLLNNKKNADLLILGNSRAKHQIDPAKLLSVQGVKYNAAIDGVGGIEFNNILLEVLLNSAIRPKVILFQTDVLAFAQDPPGNNQPGINVMYPYYDKSKRLQEFMNGLDFEERLKLNFKLYEFNGKVPNLLFNYFKKNSITDNNGFVPLSEIMDTAKPADLPLQLNDKLSFSAEKLKQLDDMIEICGQNNIRLCILFPPYYNDLGYKKMELEILKQHIRSRSGKVIVIDMAGVSKYPQLQGAENWKDFAHLNSTGASKFSTYLDDSLKNNLH